ncbi:hypothetical protein GCM10009798_40920 [Nocardioides panacihumi]|uniref:Septum formation-related domain-containing protein n=1 Tax=Nocardioides panacihumi TaxID=400774 RepID=A0ABP5D7S0_9ACTN
MNGPDLRFLAERASDLDDRTFERLGEVHQRIAVTRQRRRIATAVGAAGLVVALVAGLAVLDRGANRNSPTPAPHPTETANGDAGAVPAPPRGTCWAVPPRLAVDQRFSSDASEEVPCSQPHTTETVATFNVDKPTQQEAEGRAVTCAITVGEYLNRDQSHWIPNEYAIYLPSEAQIAEGATWMRCDAYLPAQWRPSSDPDSARTIKTSLLNTGANPAPEFWACLAQPPTKDQPFVRCDRPHAYEQSGTIASLASLASYPSAAELRAEANAECGPAVPASLAGADVTAVWQSKEDFYQGRVDGVCFMYHRNGDPLPPR